MPRPAGRQSADEGVLGEAKGGLGEGQNEGSAEGRVAARALLPCSSSAAAGHAGLFRSVERSQGEREQPPVSSLAPLAASTPRWTPPESYHDLTTGRGCYADSASNAERIAHASVIAWESSANCSSRPWVLRRTFCQKLQRILRPAGAVNNPAKKATASDRAWWPKDPLDKIAAQAWRYGD